MREKERDREGRKDKEIYIERERVAVAELPSNQ